MKILSLEINCLRGIKHLKLNLGGKNAVIYGDNGTGKSGVIDAIDFLFSGEISRISGHGTGGLTLQQHGKHVKSNPQDSWVSATVQIPQVNKNITIKRTLLNHLILECDEEYRKYFQDVEKIAQLQAHFLSRREITKYISSTDSNRAKDIENLLNLNILITNRNILQKISKEILKEFETKKTELQSITQEIDSILLTSQDNWLETINEKRYKLNCEEISELNPVLITKGIDFSKESTIKTNLLNELKIIEAFNNELYSDKGLISNLAALEVIQKSIVELEQVDMIVDNLELYNKALTSIKSDVCPVCEQPIASRETLMERLRSKIESLKSLSDLSTKRQKCCNQITTNLSNILRFYEKDYAKINQYDINSSLVNLKPLFEFINNTQVKDLTQKDCIEYTDKINIQDLLNDITKKLMTEIAKISIEKFEEEYKELTNIASRVNIFLQTQRELRELEKACSRSTILFKAYEMYQEKVLNDLYKDIENRFSFFYRFLHSKDENDFNAEFIKHGSGLEMNVQFLDGKKYPPNAVHSEGHQDSMGICLFLALSEIIEGDKLGIILLDDVVMSIDMDHRKTFCKLINEVFANKQFIITTHDFIWRKELESEGVAENNNIFYFRNWDIDNGPLYEKLSDVWGLIKDNLNVGKKQEAIGKLRYVLEEHFNYLCQKYSLLVPYSANGKWTLEQVIVPAHNFIKKTLKSALENAIHYKKGTNEIQEIIKEYEETFKQFNSDRWTLNPATHFTAWAQNLSIEELNALVISAEKYCNILKCPNCNQVANIFIDQNGDPQSIICKCGDISFSCLK